MAAKSRPVKRKPAPDRASILYAALALAEESGWASLGLSALAGLLRMPLAELHDVYRDTDAIADAWFARATRAMLAPHPEGFIQLSPKQRVAHLMLRWFDALAPHRRVTAEMLAAKMHPPHVHHWGPLVFNLSRLIQLLRDAAGLCAGGRRRQLEEIGLTVLFLMALRVWCGDDTQDQARTRRFIGRYLNGAERLMTRRCANDREH